MSSDAPVFSIQGRDVTFPVHVREAASGAATYLVDAEAARRLLPGDALEMAEPWPGRALLSLAVVDYRDNDLGDYHELSIAFFVRPRGDRPAIPYVGNVVDFFRQRLGTYIHRLPVNQGFSQEAGVRIWGFPKTVDTLDFETSERRQTCRWVQEGRHVLTVSLPRGGSRTLPEQEMVTYSWIEGVPHATRFWTSVEGMGFSLGGAELVLGEHPVADELRGLGLPRRALATVWMEHMRSRFDPPRKL